MPRVAVVILNWNGESFLRQFLRNVCEHSKNADVVVVDNGSTDDSLTFIESSLPSVKIVRLDENHGFSGGYNNGLKQVDADYFVLLNSDVEVTANWLEPVLTWMEGNDITAAQPLIKDFNSKDHFEHAGAAGGFIDENGFVFCRGRIFNVIEEDTGQYSNSLEVFWASGAALFIRSEAYWEVGGLDEQFYAHMEEIDLCWRLKNRGYRVGCCSDAHVYHVGGGTLNKLDPRKTFLNFRNNLFLLTKNCFHTPLAWLLFKRMVLDGIAAFRFLTEGKGSYFLAVVRAHFSFYGHIGKMLAKRKHEKLHRSTANLRGLYKRSIVKDFFINHKPKWSNLKSNDFRD